MSITFLNAVLAPLVVLVSVPLLLHLFARTRPPVYNFSSVEFIRRILRTTMRIKRPQDWLLLLLRTLLFAALFLLFLRPLFFARHRLAGAFQRKNVVLIVDATASMAYAEAAQTRFAAACAAASDVLGGLSGRDTANIVWLDAEPDAVFPEAGVNFAYLQSALRRARVSYESGDIPAAVRLAVGLVADLEGKSEIHILSDFQRTAWEGVRPDVPEHIELVRVRVGGGEAVNTAVTDVYCEPAVPLAGEDLTVYCDVHNYSPRPRQARLFLSVGETRQSQDVMIPAWNKGTAVFKYTPAAAVALPVTVSLGEDAFPADDRRWRVLSVRDALRIGVCAWQPSPADAWRRVLDAVDWLTVTVVDPAGLESAPPLDAIMLSGWDGTGEEQLARILERGSAVVCAPAPGLARVALLRLGGAGTGNGDGTTMAWEPLSEAQGMRVAMEGDAVFRLFAEGEYGDPSQGTFRGRLAVAGSALPGADILLAYDDGTPALARFRNGGCLFFWNAPLAPELSTWGLRPEFLPFLSELLLSARVDDPALSGGWAFEPGEQLHRRFERRVAASDVSLRVAGGEVLTVREDASSHGLRFASDVAPPPGLYEWRYRSEQVGFSAVNFPVGESDLRTLGLSELADGEGVAVSGGRSVRQMREGVRLWPYLLAAAVALVIAESATLLWVERT